MLLSLATAWLVENTTLIFRQIANFCKLHGEIQGIADGEVAKVLKHIIQLSQDSFQEKKWNYPLKMKIDHYKLKVVILKYQIMKKKKYVPLSKRQDKPTSTMVD